MPSLSPRLQSIVDALPLQPDARVLEIGCGPGAAARAVAERLTTGCVLAIDRSPAAIALASAAAEAVGPGRMTVRQVAIENFELGPREMPFDLFFAVRVGAFDGRHPRAGQMAMERIAAASTPTARLFIDGGNPLRELEIPRPR